MTLKITVVTPRLAVAGVPLAQIRFARALAVRGHDVDLVIGRGDPTLPLPIIDGVRVILLDTARVAAMFLPMLRYLRRRRPHVIFSAEDHLNGMMLAAALVARSDAKISGSSRVTPFDTYSTVPFTKRWFLKLFMRLVGGRADAMTCVSQDMVEQYRTVFPASRHVCVYNIVDDDASRARMAEHVDDPWFADREVPVVMGAGSLNHWKGFDDLIRAFALVRDRGTAARLVILGEGPERPKLEALIDALGLHDRVRLPGRTDNPLKYFAKARVFALSSHVEGMPNVLVEAMMCGCTVVAVDCPTGPRELLHSGDYGYLVPVRDLPALADGIETALRHFIPAHRVAEAIRPFEQNAVIDRHFEILGLDG